MTIAILGCGYVGSAVGSALAALGHEVIGTTTTPARTGELEGLGIAPAVLTLADGARLAPLLADRELVVLTVAAGRRGGNYREVYFEGVGHVLAALADSRVEHVVYTSSTAVYAQDDGQWVDEDSPTEPTSERGRVLLAAENRLLEGARRSGRTATVLRLSGIYGPGREPVDWVRRDAGGARSDGDAYLNLVHRDGIVQACCRLVEVRYDGVLNLSEDSPRPRRDVYDRLLAAEGLAAIRWVDREGSISRGKRISNARLKRVLGINLSPVSD